MMAVMAVKGIMEATSNSYLHYQTKGKAEFLLALFYFKRFITGD